MKTLLRILPLLLVVAATAARAAQQVASPLEENQCVTCHGNSELWEGDTQHLLVTAQHLAADIHWEKGIRCHDCHGGNSQTTKLREAHAIEDGFRAIETPADVPAFCGHCHSDMDYMRKHDPEIKADPVAEFQTSVHGMHLKQSSDPQVATCLSCHPKHEMRPAADPQSAVHVTRLSETCGNCHQDQRTALLADVHGTASDQGQAAAELPLDCSTCHGKNVHGMLAVKDRHSPVFVNNQVENCGKCHEKSLQEYLQSVHGHGLQHSGLLTTAVCASCHGAHGILPAADERSPLHPTQVADTCGSCHRFIEARVAKSVHGRGGGPGSAAEETSPGGETPRNPTCTDCHQGHDRPHPQSVRFRLQSSDSCGDCHGDLSRGYAISLHGQLNQLGYGPAAKCSDCHGAHDILPVSDPESRVAGDSRIVTCQACHLGAVQNFCNYQVHADHHDAEEYPFLHFVYLAMELLLYSVFGFFGIHTVLWFIRSLIDVIRNGSPRRLVPQADAIVRFEPIHRALHLIMVVSFLGLALTGLPLKYSDQPWALTLAGWLGGFGSTSLWHHIFGIVTVTYLVIHVVWLVAAASRRARQGAKVSALVLGPDSPVPNWRDLRDMASMFRWFFGLGRKPTFERWTYWEKFDYWAVFWGVAIIGTSGFMLWMPNLFCRFLPGEALNVAKIIHSEEALLATGFIFAIHFFNTHLRAEKFPMDMTILTGVMSEDELREERPELFRRLHREGKLDALRSTIPPRRVLWLAFGGGLIALSIGIALLVGILIAAWGR